jgi:hypothetical protein
MKSGPAIEILNPYDWLPGHGESDVTLRTDQADLIVEISSDHSSGARKRELRFKRVYWFQRSLFPGAAMTSVRFSRYEQLGSLVEFSKSEAASAWAEYLLQNGFKDVRPRHFHMLFLSENLRIDVIAEDTQLSEELPGQA